MADGATRTNGEPPRQDGQTPALAALYRLTLESLLCSSHKELVFRILNRTVELVRYDRAALFTFREGKPVLSGISGKAEISDDTALASTWKRLIKNLEDPEQSRILTRISFPGSAKAWDSLAERFPDLSVAWVPIQAEGRTVAGIWLERWSGTPWVGEELKLLASLATGYGGVWSKLEKRRGMLSRLGSALRKKRVSLVLLLLLAGLAFWPVPLRVVAECEVVPDDPVVVTAPLDGVVDEVLVDPGERVRAGQTLFVYDKRVAVEELKVARQQVRIIGSSLQRSRRQAFADAEARAEIVLLTLRLEQEKIRLALAEANFEKLEVGSPASGVAVVDDPFEWRGRPVQVGEKVLMVVNPARTKLKIRINEDDNVPFDRSEPVKVVLNAMPDRSLAARLTYVAESVTMSRDNAPTVMAEAQWMGADDNLRMGLRGVAVTYGKRVPFIYAALRKPFAALRRLIGV